MELQGTNSSSSPLHDTNDQESGGNEKRYKDINSEEAKESEWPPVYTRLLAFISSLNTD